MSFCLCEEIYVVSFLYLDTMTEYPSEVMSFLFWIIRMCQISISTLIAKTLHRSSNSIQLYEKPVIYN